MYVSTVSEKKDEKMHESISFLRHFHFIIYGKKNRMPEKVLRELQ